MRMNGPLAGKKICVLVESQFIPEELRLYRERFDEMGAIVDFIILSRRTRSIKLAAKNPK